MPRSMWSAFGKQTSSRRDAIDVDDPRHGGYDVVSVQIRRAVPDCVTSHAPGPPSPPRNLPRFPKNNDLVLDERNAHLLGHLLPALNDCKCLEISAEERRRSPWVKAFCRLHHPIDGPWGSSFFSDAPDIYDPKKGGKKYRFKGYQIPAIRGLLKDRYKGDSRVHLELRDALEEFYARDEWRKEFLRGCGRWAAAEAKKPPAERVAVPAETGVLARRPSSERGVQTDEAQVGVATNEPSGDARRSKGEPVVARKTRVGKRRAPVPGDARIVRRRSPRLHDVNDGNAEAKLEKPEEVETDEEPSEDAEERAKQFEGSGLSAEAACSDEGSGGDEEKQHGVDKIDKVQNKKPAAVSPSAARGVNARDLERTRDELQRLLSKRRSGDIPAEDSICRKYQRRIDGIDEELLEMIQ